MLLAADAAAFTYELGDAERQFAEAYEHRAAVDQRFSASGRLYYLDPITSDTAHRNEPGEDLAAGEIGGI